MPITITERAAREAVRHPRRAGQGGRWCASGSRVRGAAGFQYGLGIDEEEPEKDDKIFESRRRASRGGPAELHQPRRLDPGLGRGSRERAASASRTPTPPPMRVGLGCAEGREHGDGLRPEAEATGHGCGCEEEAARALRAGRLLLRRGLTPSSRKRSGATLPA